MYSTSVLCVITTVDNNKHIHKSAKVFLLNNVIHLFNEGTLYEKNIRKNSSNCNTFLSYSLIMSIMYLLAYFLC